MTLCGKWEVLRYICVKMTCCRLQACLHIDPAKRLTCSELLRLPYLTGVENTIPTTILKAQVATSHADHAPLIAVRLLSCITPQVIRGIGNAQTPNHRLTTQRRVQEKASEEREMLVKMRRQKRKSAELEPEAAARPVFNLTASAHASQSEAPRCARQFTSDASLSTLALWGVALVSVHLMTRRACLSCRLIFTAKRASLLLTQALCCRYHMHSTGQHRQQPAGQSSAQRAQDQRQAPQHEQSSSRTEQAELPAQQTLCTVSTAVPQPPSRLCLQLPLGTHQRQQLQAHLQLHQRYQMDLAAGHLAEQLQQQQGSSRAADHQRHVLDSSGSAGGPALSSWSQAPARSSAGLVASCGAEDSSATGAFYPVPLHKYACTGTTLCELLHCDGCVGVLDISEYTLSSCYNMRLSLPVHTVTRRSHI